MTKIKQRLFVLMMAFSIFAVLPNAAHALELHQAQAQGLVGEKLDGYIGIVQNGPGVGALVDDVNLKRRQLYREIARKNNIPLDTVERLAAEKAIARAGSGEYVQSRNGSWVRKP